MPPEGENGGKEADAANPGPNAEPVTPQKDDENEPKPDPDDSPGADYGPEVDVREDLDEPISEEDERYYEEIRRKRGESSALTEGEIEELRRLFGEDGMSGY